MDAKPQKPPRGFRVHDENAVPNPTSLKTLHSRNKSSPALSSLAGTKAAAPLPQPTKRSAFGDVSNIAAGKRAAGTARDDLALGKAAANLNKENNSLLPAKKELAAGLQPLLRPAQRPLSVATGLKNLLSHVGKPSGASGPAADASLQSASTAASVVAGLKKAAARRNTVAAAKEGGPGAAPLDAGAGLAREAPPLDAKAMAPSSMTSIPEASSRPLPVVATASGATFAQPQPLHGEYYVQDAYPRVEAGYIHAPPKKHDALAETLGNKENAQADDAARKPAVPRHDALPALRTAPAEAASLATREEPQPVQPTSATEPPEEGWYDVDDEDEHVEDDGYVTAPSFKSRGADATGGATTVLVPQVTARVRRELAAAAELVAGLRTEEEVEDDHWDSTMVAEYSEEIFAYMRELEIKMQPNPYYMDHQTEIQWSMRAVLMDWLVQVHGRFQLLPETLFLCVNYIDRFLSCKVVSLNKLQLVGATAIFVAAKYEEINCPSVGEIAYMVDHGYTVDEILKAERFMLGMLQFEMGWPGPMSFLRRISKADDYDLETRTLAKYFLELTIMDERFLGCPPSFAAAGAHCLARLMLRKGGWGAAHVHYSGYTYAQLHALVALMLGCCASPATHHQAVYEKYLDRRYKCASHFVRKELEAGRFHLPDVGERVEPAGLMGPYTPLPMAAYGMHPGYGY